ncbi:glucose/arabinose dehydrogenase [Algoriphagus boseongensis]|uniref:Glucose/arabinose dehydrogenase n=1 Tax=Algoriphagus boseongensis TaxID=1442587 RepID=A0A4R6T7A5_9BACT|nr:PQQ-dependent sugar dehydrogenase [Algoriphagus boseongensis]TDQ18536.1 glucose/arabinose dehydrogenase [Algoriphagus boseongensis]
MNKLKPIILSLALGVFSLGVAAQGKLTPISTPNSSNKRNIQNAKAEVKLDQLKLPAGFKISVWAADIPNARSMAISDNGIVFVGNRQEKNVYAVVDENADGKADAKFILAEGLRMPNGVAYKNGDLYVAEVNRILRFKDIKNNLTNPKYEVVYDGYPTDGHHGWKFISFGPDGMLYVPVGAPCNICESENPIYASITRLDVSKPGAKPEIYAQGVRNTVGFDWRPGTTELWFTDNGRDMMGDDIPDCELNRATAKGQHFGYPYWHAGTVKDPDFGDKGKAASAYVAPAAKMGPHNAPLGMRFYEGGMFPTNYKNSAIIAKHGSWNRSKKAGYQVVVAKIDGTGKVTGQEVLISGWLNDATQDVWGRPVDVQELPDGSLLVSDDMANCIYRVTYSK